MHNKKVSVRKRIEDVKERYWNWSKENNIFFEKMIQKNEEVENELNFLI